MAVYINSITLLINDLPVQGGVVLALPQQNIKMLVAFTTDSPGALSWKYHVHWERFDGTTDDADRSGDVIDVQTGELVLDFPEWGADDYTVGVAVSLGQDPIWSDQLLVVVINKATPVPEVKPYNPNLPPSNVLPPQSPFQRKPAAPSTYKKPTFSKYLIPVAALAAFGVVAYVMLRKRK